ncbi:MAG: protein kinase [Candidatus Fermentibacteraceae bacterium]|nr:protein kinase [Candidatus Fermentibacteraceae bacterium]
MISQYRILEKLGEGGMGVVYKALDTRLNRTVALKFLPAELTRNPEAEERFIHEARAASALNHPGINTIFDINEANGRTFIAMAYLEGRSLREIIESGPLELDKALDIAIQVAEGLQEAHERGIVHCDVNPTNIMVTPQGQAKIMDFGLAMLSGIAETARKNRILGTAAYMSPEQTSGGEIDQRTDIWALGVALYEMITGEVPFKGEYEQAVVYSILNEDPEPVTGLRTGILADLSRIVERALKKNPEERYQQMDEMLSHLNSLCRELGTSDEGERRIAVISFENQTGEQAFDYLRKAIPNLLITSLEQSEYLLVVTWERLQDLLKVMGKVNAEIIDKELGFELCRLDGIETIVVGSFTRVGEIFATDVKVLDVETKKIRSCSTSRGVGVDSILERQIDELSGSISRGLGITGMEEAGGRPIAEVTSSSMDAYSSFLKGRECFEKLYNDDARKYLERAVSLDPSFAVAYMYLAKNFDRLHDTRARNDAFEKARALSGRATNKERLYIEAACARALDGDVEKRFRILKQLAREYPKEKRVHQELASHYRGRERFYQAVAEYNKVLELDPCFGWALNELAYMYTDIGEFEQAHDYFQRYASISPGDANPIDSMGELYFRMGKLDEAKAKYLEALEVKPDFYYAYWETAYIYALQERYPECMKWIDNFIDRAPSFGTRTDGLRWKCFYLCWQGSFHRALPLAERMTELSEEEGSEYWITEADRLKGWIHYERDELDLSRGCFQRCMDSVRGNPTEYIPAATSYSLGSPEQLESLTATYVFALAMVDLKEGRLDSARSRLAEIEPLLPDYSELLRGELLLAEGFAEKAVAVVEKAPPWRIPYISDTGGMLVYNLPFLKDVLARAYLQKGDADNAIAEYERLTTFRPDSKNRHLVHPRYHYRLAELYDGKNLPKKAVEQYGKSLECWKEADQDLPELMDTRADLERL